MIKRLFWESQNKRTQIIRHCDVAFELIHDGITVMEGRFEPLCKYVWAEFIDWPGREKKTK